MKQLPKSIFSGYWPEGHVQGIALDMQKGHVYYSFTTMLLKTDFYGNPLASVGNIAGHLGCITFDPAREMVYASLEYKSDAIGREIQQRTGSLPPGENAFYIAGFDARRMDRMQLDSQNDGVMTAVYLADVLADFENTDPVSGAPHVFGCSGIDGIALGPAFGSSGEAQKLMVCYGIYGDVSRTDNDHQVLLQYDPDIFRRYARPLCCADLHHSGPQKAEERYFIYTGNTTYGIQNLEYDPCSGSYIAAVYKGEKPEFSNPPMFLIDASKAPVSAHLKGREGECGLLLTLSSLGERGSCEFPLGQTGVFSLGDGRFFFSEPLQREQGGETLYGALLQLCRIDPHSPQLFQKV